MSRFDALLAADAAAIVADLGDTLWCGLQSAPAVVDDYDADAAAARGEYAEGLAGVVKRATIATGAVTGLVPNKADVELGGQAYRVRDARRAGPDGALTVLYLARRGPQEDATAAFRNGLGGKA